MHNSDPLNNNSLELQVLELDNIVQLNCDYIWLCTGSSPKIKQLNLFEEELINEMDIHICEISPMELLC